MSLRAALCLIAAVVLVHSLMFATTPVITVTSPTNNSTSTSPVQFKATATSADCSGGISAMRVYSAPYVIAYTIAGGNLNAYLNLNAGTYDTTIVAWDNCGGTAAVDVTVTASGQKEIGGFLYTANSNYADFSNTNVNNVVGFSIVASNGALAQLLQGPVNTNISPGAVASDKGGYRLYVGDWASKDVFAYFIDRDNGYLTPVPRAPFSVSRPPSATAVHPNGDYVYVAVDENLPGDGISVFQVQSDGSLSEISGSPFSTQQGPQALVVDPAGNYLYVADESSYIEVFAINRSNGALTPVSGSPFLIPMPDDCESGPGASVFPTDIIDPFGKSIYIPDNSVAYISGWSTSSATGSITPLSGSPWIDNSGCAISKTYRVGPEPNSLAVDGTGKFLYVNSSNVLEGIVIYSIAGDGALTYVKTVDANSDVGCDTPIRTDSTGNYLYTGGCQNGVPAGTYYNSIVGYSINHTTGDITPLPESPFVYPEPAIYTLLTSFAVTP
jgi:6-phosphogluconolactonase (cycloisomerase 2 family)